ncbi:hypothetical protein DID77_01255 [Candidatus Marinamargulisbacteria bacterium SCGC AG-439-L15]|nr:hypothetical protein DID77_01255 [Candidatus Marinamargulisbacteria bacterium SCGC AG-439-L15]
MLYKKVSFSKDGLVRVFHEETPKEAGSREKRKASADQYSLESVAHGPSKKPRSEESGASGGNEAAAYLAALDGVNVLGASVSKDPSNEDGGFIDDSFQRCRGVVTEDKARENDILLAMAARNPELKQALESLNKQGED